MKPTFDTNIETIIRNLINAATERQPHREHWTPEATLWDDEDYLIRLSTADTLQTRHHNYEYHKTENTYTYYTSQIITTWKERQSPKTIITINK